MPLIPILWVAGAATGGLLVGRIDEDKSLLKAVISIVPMAATAASGRYKGF